MTIKKTNKFLSLCLVTLSISFVGVVLGAEKSALVIGNSAYSNFQNEQNIRNAQIISSVLESAGFSVTSITNQNRTELRKQIRDYARTLAQNKGIGLFYFAGQVGQFDGKNYLIPLGADLQHSFEIPDEAVSIDYLLTYIAEAQNELSIVIVEPSAFSVNDTDDQTGLANQDVPAKCILLFANKPGAAIVSSADDTSIFARKLINGISEPGLELETLLKKVRTQVTDATNGRQEPWINGVTSSGFYFVEKNSDDQNAGEMVAASVEWATVKSSDNPMEIRRFIEKYPTSPYRGAANFRLRKLEREFSQAN